MRIFSFLGEFSQFCKGFWESNLEIYERLMCMRKKNFKGRCIKEAVGKAKEVCRTYDSIQHSYLSVLQNNPKIKIIKCNVAFDDPELGEYTSDYLCTKVDNDLMVRECVYRRLLSKPKTAKLLDASRNYWLKHGVNDWGLVVDAKE